MFRASPQLFFPLALTFTLVHYLALQFHMYWYLDSLDMVMHLWGGFLIVVALYMLHHVSQGRLQLAWWFVVLVVVGGMLSWEVLEYSLGLTGTQPDFIRDTGMDLLCGAAGAVVGYILLKK